MENVFFSRLELSQLWKRMDSELKKRWAWSDLEWKRWLFFSHRFQSLLYSKNSWQADLRHWFPINSSTVRQLSRRIKIKLNRPNLRTWRIELEIIDCFFCMDVNISSEIISYIRARIIAKFPMIICRTDHYYAGSEWEREGMNGSRQWAVFRYNFQVSVSLRRIDGYCVAAPEIVITASRA